MKTILKKLFLPITILVLFADCTNHTDTIKIPLHTEMGYGPFYTSRYFVSPSKDSLSYKGVPSNIKEYVVRCKHYQIRQFYWNQFKTGKISEDQFSKYLTRYKIDTTKLTRESVDEGVLYLIGTNEDGKRVIIVDTDNDENFSNEKILEFEYPQSIEKQKDEFGSSLPIVTVTYEYFKNGKIEKKNLDVKPSPYLGSLRITYNTDKEIEKKYHLFISVPKHKKSTIRINKISYDIIASNEFFNNKYSPKNTSIFFQKKGEAEMSQIKGDIPYQIGDVFNAGGADYKIESVSRFGDSLILNYLGENMYPVGVTEGLYLPKLSAVKLNYSIFDIGDYHDKYILFDFWGTWCNPCIKLIPELKMLNQEYQDNNFVLVSIAYDLNIETVKDFVSKEDMDWIHLFVSQSKNDKNSIINKLKIISYPSTILVAPDGKIIARNKDIKELKQILNERLNAL